MAQQKSFSAVQKYRQARKRTDNSEVLKEVVDVTKHLPMFSLGARAKWK